MRQLQNCRKCGALVWVRTESKECVCGTPISTPKKRKNIQQAFKAYLLSSNQFKRLRFNLLVNILNESFKNISTTHIFDIRNNNPKMEAEVQRAINKVMENEGITDDMVKSYEAVYRAGA